MDDYIKRDDALNLLCDICVDNLICDKADKSECHRKFMDIPAADVRENVLSKWVHPVPGDGEPYCLSCKKNAPFFFGYGTYEPDFCPHCGADMRGEEGK